MGLVVAVGAASAAGADLARGWGDGIPWTTLDALDVSKPTMVVIHKSWCGACKRLKPLVAESARVAALADHFNMVNLQDDEEPADDQFKPVCDCVVNRDVGVCAW